ncbi:MAG: hypothetical protein J6J43_09325 [Oscillospiraceae bacterium]|nr:hypothetical protein [Oscillospiraceae bacterium]
MAKRKQPMPSYYGKNIAQHAQRRFLARWEAEHPKKRDRILLADELETAPDREREEQPEE